jgi:DNA adenine methylase
VTIDSAIKWHGGKSYLAKRIVGLFPPHLHYVEPFFGGGAVLFARDSGRDWLGEGQPSSLRGGAEVVNDLNGRLVNFWRVIADRDAFQEFVRLVELTPVGQDTFDSAKDLCADSVRDAVAFFVRNRQSRQGLGKDFATLSRNRTRRGMNEQVSAWLSAIDGLPEIHERLQRIVILNADAIKVIEQQDGPLSLFYCDPPYLHETRSSTGEYGNHEMTVEQHRRLLECLSRIQGKFVLSGYPSGLYSEFKARFGWHLVEITIDNKASSKKEKPQKTECLLMNYQPAKS